MGGPFVHDITPMASTSIDQCEHSVTSPRNTSVPSQRPPPHPNPLDTISDTVLTIWEQLDNGAQTTTADQKDLIFDFRALPIPRHLLKVGNKNIHVMQRIPKTSFSG